MVHNGPLKNNLKKLKLKQNLGSRKEFLKIFIHFKAIQFMVKKKIEYAYKQNGKQNLLTIPARISNHS